MDDTCWKVIGLAIVVVAGLATALGVVWRYALRKDKEVKETHQLLISEKERYIQTLIAFKERLTAVVRKHGPRDQG